MVTNEPLRLITIPISPYCEKVRWGLDRAGLSFVEEGHLQVVHYRAARKAGGGRTVPVLVTPDGALGDSTEILHWIDESLAEEDRLFPSADSGRELWREVSDLEDAFDEPFGSDTRLWAYHLFLVHPVFAARFLLRFHTIPLWQRLVAPFFLPFMSRFIKRRYDIQSSSAQESEDRARKVLDDVAARLEDGRTYLCGERFTAADMTFACHSSAVSLPPEYGAPIARFEDLPKAAQQRAAELHRHPACEFSRRVYREQRNRRVRTAASAAD